MKLHKNFYIVLSYLIISFVCMLFLTTSSPLFTINPSFDGNTTFTVGKGLLHGLIPYKDLFDQRGPLNYLINSVAALISYRSFLGIYIFESIALFVDLFFIYKILTLKYSTKLSIISSFTVIPFVFNTVIFDYGDLAEEYMLPLIFVTIYLLTSKSVNDWNKFEYIMMGLFASLAFWVKFPMMVTWIAVYLVLVIYFIYRKSWNQLFHSILYGIVGFLPVTLFITILYGLKHALGNLYYVYFYLNMSSYNHPISVTPKLTQSFAIVAVVFLIIYIQEYELTKPNLSVLILVVVLNYVYLWKFAWLNYYYDLFAFVFLIVPVIMCMFLTNYKLFRKIMYIIPMLTIVGIYASNKNFVKYSIKSSANVQVPLIKKFASIIDKSKDKTLLNYGRLDEGIYTYSGTLPNNKYFVKGNLNYAPMLKAQASYFNSKKYKFIFTPYEDDVLSEHQKNILKNDYKIAAKQYGFDTDLYVLYQRKY